MYFHTLCLCISAGHCHLSHCEGLLLTLAKLSVSAVHLKPTWQVNWFFSTRNLWSHRLVSLCCWCGSSLFYFLVFLLPADHLCLLFLFFNIGFSSCALIANHLCCVSSSVSVELNFFFFLNPLPAYLCFFPASHWRAVKHWANLVPQNYFSLLYRPFLLTAVLCLCAYVTHKCPAAAERLHPLFATAQSCSFSWATSVTHLTPLFAIWRINQKTILF